MMRRGSVLLILVTVVVTTISACEPQPELPKAQVTPEDSVVAPAADDPILQAPSGGWLDWIADMRAGLANVNTQAAEDRNAALENVQQLIQSRHAYLVQYFGPGGSAHAG